MIGNRCKPTRRLQALLAGTSVGGPLTEIEGEEQVSLGIKL